MNKIEIHKPSGSIDVQSHFGNIEVKQPDGSIEILDMDTLLVGLISHWRFDEGEGSVAKDSVGGNDARSTATPLGLRG